MNEWTELSLTVRAEDTEKATAIAGMTTSLGLYIEDYRDLEKDALAIAHSDLLDPSLTQKDRRHSVIHLYFSPEDNLAKAAAFLQDHFLAAGIPVESYTAPVREEDWANSWKQYFKPIPIGKKLWICPTWETVPPPEGRILLTIDPGMAFGTGTHETTRMVLEELENRITPRSDMLDIGCGSGILSIASLLLGANSAYATDIDPLSVKTARENGKRCGFAPPKYTVVQSNLASGVTGSFDVIAANIVADAIIALAPDVFPLLKPNGLFIVSGIIQARENDVRQAVGHLGFHTEHRRELREWVCLAMTR